MSNPGNGNNSSSQAVDAASRSDDDDDLFDNFSAAGLEEIHSDEFPTHFIERDDRLFPSHGSSPYPLPVDTPEQRRLNVEHVALKRLIGANYVGPVAWILRAEPRSKLVLDIGHGTGKWLLEMAEQFPHVQFRGIDIVPIATRYPPDNVRFEIADANEPLRWDNDTVDLVHIRDMYMATRTYPGIIHEAARVLRPGGLLLCCEWGFCPTFYPDIRADLRIRAPGLCHFYDLVRQSLMQLGIHPIAEAIPSWLATSGQFDGITPQMYFMPIGPWHQDPDMRGTGRGYRAARKRFTDSVRPMLINAGWDPVALDEIFAHYRQELRTVMGMVSIYHTVFALKRIG